ncbi:MAG: hypothetical protein LBL07_00850 [Tannerella sp.]|jgi:hypothetical protein|nr:hypothetical protein [Tannerella sp.]
MKYKLVFVFISCVLFGYSFHKKPKLEIFVRQCEFVCDYPFNDTTKWAITCRVWGLLKYFHPNVTAGTLDWDKVLLDRLDAVNSASSPEAVNTELEKMLDAAGKYSYIKGDEEWVDFLSMNVNLCWLDNSYLDKTLREELKKIASLPVKRPSYYGLDFETVMIQNEKEYVSCYADTSYKYQLLTLFRYWNVIYYYSPHKYLMDESWDKILAESVFPFFNATDKQSLETALLKLATSLNDGHAFIFNVDDYPYKEEYQYIIEKVEGKTIIRTDAGGLNKGDIINCIEETDINCIRDSLSALIPASTQGNKEYRINCAVAKMMFSNETDVTVARNDRILKIHTSPVTSGKPYTGSFKRISDKTAYVDISFLITEEIDSMFQSFSDVSGVIFDLRKSGPNFFDYILFCCHLNKDVIRMEPFIFNNFEHPGSFYMTEGFSVPNSGKCPQFKKKMVFLINEFSQSFYETVALNARTNLHATLIGRPTSGALGRIVKVPLPGNYTACFSGVGLFSHDGTELQRKGIIPDIEVHPSLESIKAGKDEILEAAIEYFNNQ